MNDDAMLDEAEAHAWRGIRRGLGGLGSDVVTGLDLEDRVRRHPYVSVGVACAAIAFLGMALLRCPFAGALGFLLRATRKGARRGAAGVVPLASAALRALDRFGAA